MTAPAGPVTLALYLALACEMSLWAQKGPVEEAWALLGKGQRPQAIRLLYETVKAEPGNADARLLLGSVLQEEGDAAGSIAQLTEAVKLRPGSAEAQDALGEAFNAAGDTKAARGPFQKAVAIDPKFAQAQLNLGLVLLDAENSTRRRCTSTALSNFWGTSRMRLTRIISGPKFRARRTT